MKYFKLEKVIRVGFFVLAILILAPLASAQETSQSTRIRRYDTQYDGNDSGRYRGNSELWNKINAVSALPIIINLKMPLIFGPAPANLEDTWGDARDSGRTHEGVDIMAPRGTQVISPTDAVVTTIENSGNGGNHVFTANPGGERFYFAHLDSFAPGLVEGQVLKPGDLIGYVGNTGNAAGGPTHLHFGIYQGDHVATNPFPRLTAEFNLAKATAIMSTPVLGIVRTLRLGSKGDDVKALQVSLNLTPDGSFGPKTKAAVITFQANHGLVADGVFGAMSRAALGNIAPVPGAGCAPGALYSTTTGIRCPGM